MAAVNVTLEQANISLNQSTCDLFVDQLVAVVLFPVFYSAVFVISTCGNSLVLYVIWRRRQKFNSTSVYLVNLALSDSLFTLALPSRVVYYARHFDWPFGDFLCRVSMLLFFANTYAGNKSALALRREREGAKLLVRFCNYAPTLWLFFCTPQNKQIHLRFQSQVFLYFPKLSHPF